MTFYDINFITTDSHFVLGLHVMYIGFNNCVIFVFSKCLKAMEHVV